MNHNHDHPDQTALELATARSLPPGAVLSADRAAERDGFLALGAALDSAAGPLDSAAGPLDDAALLARLQTQCVEEPAAIAPFRPHRTDNAWQAALSVALAAAALFALARIAVQSPAVLERDHLQIAQHESPPSSQVNDATVPESVSAQTTAWHDPLDDELAFAQAAFESLSTDDRGVDGSLTRMNSRLEALSQELHGGSL